MRETQEYQILPTRCLAVANAAALSLSFLPSAYTNLKGKHGYLLHKPTAGSGQNENYLTEEFSYQKLHKVPLWEISQVMSTGQYKESTILVSCTEHLKSILLNSQKHNLHLCSLTAANGTELRHQKCQTCGRAFCCKC